jgi:hypothetical protein
LFRRRRRNHRRQTATPSTATKPAAVRAEQSCDTEQQPAVKIEEAHQEEAAQVAEKDQEL